MKNMFARSLMLFVSLLSLGLSACEEKEVHTLSLNQSALTIAPEGGSAHFSLQTSAPEWSIENPASDWLSVSRSNGTEKMVTISLQVNGRSLTPRSATLILRAGNAPAQQLVVSQASSEFLYVLSVDGNVLQFGQSGGEQSFTVSGDAPVWTMQCKATWLTFSTTTGGIGSTSIKATAQRNPDSTPRSTTIQVQATGGPLLNIQVNQKGDTYPNYNLSPKAPDASGMESSATQLAAKIRLGWNIGNTLEAIGSETAWGNPKVTRALIQLVKQSGFNAIRIPCAWNQYMDDATTAKLKTQWLDRVKEVVQYCVDEDLYVLVNIHWDGGWLENNCTEARQEANNAKQKAFWQQIATHLRDFDEHLLLASANEPNVDNATQMAVLNSYHQTFIDAVRATGGRNAHRVLVVQGPATDVEKTNKLMTYLPTDPTPNRMMVEVHYYTPWTFCGMEKDETWGKMAYFWGKDYHSTTNPGRNATFGEEADVVRLFGLMKRQFVDKGIPVLMGEFGATRRSALTGDDLTRHLASRAYYLKYTTRTMREHGILPFFWDNGGLNNHASGIFNRQNNTVFDKLALDALVEGAAN